MQQWEALAYAREGGIEKGRYKGEKIQLINQICKKLTKNKSPEVIAEELEEDLAVVAEICKAAEESAPDYDCEHIYRTLYEKEEDPDAWIRDLI